MPTAPSSDPKERLQQLKIIKAAYDELTPARPTLPAPGSPIPALIAATTVQATITKTKAAITNTRDQLTSLSTQISREEAQLSDANLLTRALQSRIARLRATADDRTAQPPAALARQQLATQQRRARDLTAETRRLRTELDAFIDARLAPMLAAEELGGPVVGELPLDVDDGVLEAGFSAQGRPRAGGQRRIDEIWAAGEEVEEEEEDAPQSAGREAAAAEMRALLEELVEAGAGRGDSGVYVRLERDSAAARFLVRARVAVFHPKDARRLRLVDFGREFDD